MAHPSLVVLQLLQRARRRHLVQLIIEQTGIAFGAAMAAVTLLLLLGTQVLDWYWILPLLGGAVVFGAWRIRRLTPEPYGVAQIIDSRLELHDAISTAYFFAGEEHQSKNPEAIAIQRKQAERAAARADLAVAFPYVVPKALYGALGVALVAFGMFAVRYGITRSLDLRPSLVKIAFDTFAKSKPEPVAEKKEPAPRRDEQQMQKLGVNSTSPETNPNRVDPTPNSLLTAANSNVNNARAESDAAKSKQPAENEREATSPDKDQQSGENSESGSESPSIDENQQGQSAPQSAQRNGQKQNPSAEAKKDSLLDKMRDAMANLLNKMKMQPRGQSGQQMARSGQSGRSQQEASDKDAQSAGRNKSEAAGSPGERGESQQADGAQAQGAQGKSGEHAGRNQPSQDAKSGIGKEDGDKSSKLAEQLAAMGKISEILGKRAQNVSGEVMVEVSSGSQSLRTQYSGRTAVHSDAGGEISRDEVPLMYRQYVQHYFEQIRAPAAVHGSRSRPGATDVSAAPSSRKSRVGEE